MEVMSPTELFHEARLNEAIDVQRAIVDAHPDDVAERLLFCELLAFTGDRTAVRRQLDVLADVPADVGNYVAEWRRLLNADDARHRGDRPTFLTDPPGHVVQRIQAVESHRNGREEDTLDRLDEADEASPWVVGHIDGRPFDGWRDADDLLGPVLELFRGDRYVWLPTDQVQKLRLEDGDELRDTLYRPATVWLADGSRHEVFLPGLYARTADHPEEGIRTGAGIDWVEVDGITRGLGARTFLFGEEELTSGEFRQVEVRG